MRPDKKKKQHHDSRKKAEKARQASAPGEVGQDPGTTSGSGIGAKQESIEQSTPTSRDEKSSKESSKATKVVEQKPPINISSNWTKYEIPSSDEEDSEDTSTGLNFNFVLENAGIGK